MKIYFCDGCNESVPLGDIQSGRVTTIKGKLFCASCLPPGVLEPPRSSSAAPAEGSSSRGTHVLLGLVVLLLGVLVWQQRGALFGSEGVDGGAAGRSEGGRAALVDDVDRMGAQMLQIDADLARLSRDVTSLRADLEDLRAADADHDRSVTRLGDEIARLLELQVEAGGIVERVHLLDGRTESLQQRFAALSDAVASHETAISLGVMPAADGASDVAAPVAKPEPRVDPVRQAEVESVRRLLLDEAPDLRYDAIERASLGRMVELVPELIQRIGDPDMFVRMYAMEVLADFGAEEAVEPLFEALDDGAATIRRSAAEALVRLLGYDPGYDYRASPAERKRSVEEWRAWYAER